MRRATWFVWLLLISVSANSGPQKRRLSDSDLKAVVQAVEDEIYDYGYQKQFDEVGENIGAPGSAPQARMRIYIEPEIGADESGRIIYKLMPYGEILREFVIRSNGLVVFGANPENGFPPTDEANTKTVYMDDDEVCRMKHNWVRSFFVVSDSPSPEMIHEAAKRQKLRTGFSDWEYRHSGEKNK
jgi:hypothetical protein